jgi:hypothetical protein
LHLDAFSTFSLTQHSDNRLPSLVHRAPADGGGGGRDRVRLNPTLIAAAAVVDVLVGPVGCRGGAALLQ